MRFQFILSEIAIGLRRNLAMTVSVVLVTFVSLTFVGAGALMQQQVSTMKGDWYDRVQVAIFLCTADSLSASCSGAAGEEDKAAIQTALTSPPLSQYVSEVQFESSDEAYAQFQAQDEQLSASVTPDQLPESFRVGLVDPERFGVISESFQGSPGVEEVVDQREVLEPFFAVLNAATAGSLALAGVMLVAAVLLIGTTIRLAAFNRRRETGIMRLVGASSTFLQLPFLLEGVIAVCLGAALAGGVLLLAVDRGVTGWLAQQVPAFDYITATDVWATIPWLFLGGIVLASVASLVSLSRYLKV
ncbi:permease-like cell division protein FtsX [uncultured Pseudokineococcus sp.]|uniref:permease-like cell division protein FtsX n=1 Tax=uncultured Pseudokineococcus sp. TaxID=1642928 RepID=UPI00262F1647|nr:permease-like cell division protein FtsX [uncultured Pseudokineococcus sp.]